jgi:membrane-bound ClpP family serine protease
MSPPTQDGNKVVEQQLDRCVRALEDVLQADVLAFTGGIVFGTDDIIRNVIEEMRRRPNAHPKLAVMLTTLGGYIEIVQRVAEMLRHHYNCIDFIVPNYAYSAGTVLVMSGDSIYMNYYSRLGPIDPQVETAPGKLVSALGYLIQWERLLNKAKKGELTTVEAQLMIDGFNQAELYQYEQARALSVDLLKDWLVKYKFKDWTTTETRKLPVTHGMRVRRASDIAKKLNKTEKWHSHNYGISMEVLRRDLRLKIEDFDTDLSLGKKINNYYNLLSDYMMKRSDEGVVHTKGRYIPFVWGEQNA